MSNGPSFVAVWFNEASENTVYIEPRKVGRPPIVWVNRWDESLQLQMTPHNLQYRADYEVLATICVLTFHPKGSLQYEYKPILPASQTRDILPQPLT
jgi:hypothetical protein